MYWREDRFIDCSLSWGVVLFVLETGFHLSMILPPPPPKFWDYRHMPPYHIYYIISI
jgi:hypothetical protein